MGLNTDELYSLCARDGIEVHSIKCPHSNAISMDIGGVKFIGMDRSVFKSAYNERLVLAHELSHAQTGAYYSDGENPINVKRMEFRAKKRTVELLIPLNELEPLLCDDVTVFDLAEHFSVPEDLIKAAMWFYFKKEIA